MNNFVICVQAGSSRAKGLTALPFLFLAQEAIRYYEPIVKKQAETILEVPAIVLANLCVSHIMISQNEEAEELMRKVCSMLNDHPCPACRISQFTYAVIEYSIMQGIVLI